LSAKENSNVDIGYDELREPELYETEKRDRPDRFITQFADEYLNADQTSKSPTAPNKVGRADLEA